MDTEIIDCYDEEDVSEGFFLPSIVGDAFESSSSGDDVDPWVSHPRIRLPCGDGTSRMDRASPCPYLPSINGGPETRRHFGMEREWSRVYFNLVAPPRLGERA